MAYPKAFDEYRKSSVNGASPVALVVMLYDGCLRFMETGRIAMTRRELEAQNVALQKAQKIVLELMSALDMRKGGDVAKNLMALYSYVLGELVGANLEDKPERIENAIRTMSELRQGWSEIEAQQRTAAPDSGYAPIARAA
ncbi:flagellar export chaperone FliS [bacterium]|nr:MAG: flagellar export chaperone FliS [bacterium]